MDPDDGLNTFLVLPSWVQLGISVIFTFLLVLGCFHILRCLLPILCNAAFEREGRSRSRSRSRGGQRACWVRALCCCCGLLWKVLRCLLCCSCGTSKAESRQRDSSPDSSDSSVEGMLASRPLGSVAMRAKDATKRRKLRTSQQRACVMPSGWASAAWRAYGPSGRERSSVVPSDAALMASKGRGRDVGSRSSVRRRERDAKCVGDPSKQALAASPASSSEAGSEEGELSSSGESRLSDKAPSSERLTDAKASACQSSAPPATDARSSEPRRVEVEAVSSSACAALDESRGSSPADQKGHCHQQQGREDAAGVKTVSSQHVETPLARARRAPPQASRRFAAPVDWSVPWTTPAAEGGRVVVNLASLLGRNTYQAVDKSDSGADCEAAPPKSAPVATSAGAHAAAGQPGRSIRGRYGTTRPSACDPSRGVGAACRLHCRMSVRSGTCTCDMS